MPASRTQNRRVLNAVFDKLFTAIKALGEGMVKLTMGTDFHLELHKVLYVPKLAKNLLSVQAMISMGAKVKFKNEE